AHQAPDGRRLVFQALLQIVEHETRGVDTGDANASTSQGQGHTPVATPVLEHLPPGPATEANVAGDVLGACRVATLIRGDVDVVRERARVQRQVRSTHARVLPRIRTAHEAPPPRLHGT